MRTSHHRAISAVLVVTFLATTPGCATSAKNVGTSYVSPIQYQSYSCAQLSQEVQRIAVRVGEVTGRVDDKATRDAVAMGVGLVLFWPALFFLSGGNSADTAELSRLKGEYDALQQAAVAKSCQEPPAVPPAKDAKQTVTEAEPATPR